MFIYNLKINSNFILKLFLTILLVTVLFIIGISIFKLINGSSSTINNSNVYNLTPNNYTNVLKAVHNDLNTYIGQQIKFSGYVYRLINFNDNQFVLARDMLVSPSDNQSLVVGFLCHYDSASLYEDNTWVNITRNYN